MAQKRSASDAPAGSPARKRNNTRRDSFRPNNNNLKRSATEAPADTPDAKKRFNPRQPRHQRPSGSGNASAEDKKPLPQEKKIVADEKQPVANLKSTVAKEKSSTTTLKKPATEEKQPATTIKMPTPGDNPPVIQAQAPTTAAATSSLKQHTIEEPVKVATPVAAQAPATDATQKKDTEAESKFKEEDLTDYDDGEFQIEIASTVNGRVHEPTGKSSPPSRPASWTAPAEVAPKEHTKVEATTEAKTKVASAVAEQSSNIGPTPKVDHVVEPILKQNSDTKVTISRNTAVVTSTQKATNIASTSQIGVNTATDILKPTTADSLRQMIKNPANASTAKHNNVDQGDKTQQTDALKSQDVTSNTKKPARDSGVGMENVTQDRDAGATTTATEQAGDNKPTKDTKPKMSEEDIWRANQAREAVAENLQYALDPNLKDLQLNAVGDSDIVTVTVNGMVLECRITVAKLEKKQSTPEPLATVSHADIAAASNSRPAGTPSVRPPPSVVSGHGALIRAKANIPCKWGKDCKNGARCPFTHSHTNTNTTAALPSRCVFVNMPIGCTKGDKCQFSHAVEGVKCTKGQYRSNCRNGRGCHYKHDDDIPGHQNQQQQYRSIQSGGIRKRSRDEIGGGVHPVQKRMRGGHH